MSENPRVSAPRLLTHRVLPHDAKAVKRDLHALDVAVKADATLARGAKGAKVSALQRELARLGLYHGKVNGAFDAATEAAVKKLQAARGTAQTGVFDAVEARSARAHEKLVKDGFNHSPARVGQSGKDVLSLERRLDALGYGTGKVDGVMDQATLAAVRRFRKDAKDVPDQGDYASSTLYRAAGKRVADTERNLRAVGYQKVGTPNGSFGKASAKAVRAFQMKHHLEVTGEANAKTRSALSKAAAKAGRYPHVSPRHFQHGYDVSAWQTTAQVRSLLGKKSTKFLGMKATDGTGYTNPNFKKWWSMAGKKLGPGKLDLRIAYHYLQPGNGRAQADRLLKTVGVHGRLKPGTRLALDWEGAALGSTKSLRDAAKRIHQVTGTWPLIYTSASQLGRAKAAVPHAPMWDAHYPPDRSDYQNPFVQTSGDGVDHDVFTGSELALRKWAGW
ncbi:MAG: peptidoglycan-binding protein [Archangiaceae bacterium]|nr:peptidoglycan-binding protein [Archangiaceae bacterium]